MTTQPVNHSVARLDQHALTISPPDAAQTSLLISLPIDIQHFIFSWIRSPWERIQVSETCKHFYHAMQDPVLCRVLARVHLPSDMRPLKEGHERQDYVARCRMDQNIRNGESNESTISKMKVHRMAVLPGLKEKIVCEEVGACLTHVLDITGVVHRTISEILQISCTAVFPNGTIACAYTNSTLSICYPMGREWCVNMPSNCFAMVVLSEQKLAYGCADGPIHILDAKSGAALKILRVPADDVIFSPMCMVALSDGNLVSGRFSKEIRVWNPTSGALLQTCELETGRVMSMAALSNGNFISGSNDQVISMWDSKNGKLLQAFTWSTTPDILAMLPNGHLILTDNDTTIEIWDLKSRAVLLRFGKHHDCIGSRAIRINCIAVLSDERILFGTSSGIKILDFGVGNNAARRAKAHIAPNPRGCQDDRCDAMSRGAAALAAAAAAEPRAAMIRAAEPLPPPSRLQVQYNTGWGNHLEIRGTGPEMSWECGRKLRKGEGDCDTWLLDLSPDCRRFEYKVVLIKKDGTEHWEEIEGNQNRVFTCCPDQGCNPVFRM